MSHEIDMSNERANIAFTGSRNKIWHSLGTEMKDDQPLEDWIVQAGLDWDIQESPVYFNNGSVNSADDYVGYSDRKVLYRSDTKSPLSVVGKDFKVVQPKQIVEFFRDLIAQNNMKLNTAGSLFGGKRFWALAELGKEAQITEGDLIRGYLLLITSADGSLCTTGKFVSERPICNNTVSIALRENTKHLVKVSHRSEWDADKVKIDLGLMDESWFNFISNMRKLANTKATDKVAEEFYQKLVFEHKKEDPTRAELRKVEKLMDFYKNGAGSELSTGSYWGLLNGLTEMFTHGSGRKDSSHQFFDANIAGYQDNMKNKGMDLLLSMV